MRVLLLALEAASELVVLKNGAWRVEEEEDAATLDIGVDMKKTVDPTRKRKKKKRGREEREKED